MLGQRQSGWQGGGKPFCGAAGCAGPAWIQINPDGNDLEQAVRRH